MRSMVTWPTSHAFSIERGPMRAGSDTRWFVLRVDGKAIEMTERDLETLMADMRAEINESRGCEDRKE